MSKFRLEVTEGYDFLCYGISCHLKDYKLAWTLNKNFQLELKRLTLVHTTKAGEPIDFALFKHSDTKHHVRYFLLNNRSEGVPLVKDYKQFNFLLLVEGFIDLFEGDEFAREIQLLDAVQLITPLPTEPIEQIQYELFED